MGENVCACINYVDLMIEDDRAWGRGNGSEGLCIN
jgi:hypothetical protein